MNEQHLRGYSQLSLLSEPKRKRTPSSYAAQIADFKSSHTSFPKKAKTIRFHDNERINEDNPREIASNALPCVLPSGKKYFLKIVGGKIKNRKLQRKKQSKRQTQSVAVKDEKKKETTQSFFDTLLKVCEQLQRKSDQGAKEHAQNSKESEEKFPTRKEEKVRRQKEKEDRWGKFYERFRVLSERMDKLQVNYIFLD